MRMSKKYCIFIFIFAYVQVCVSAEDPNAYKDALRISEIDKEIKQIEKEIRKNQNERTNVIKAREADNKEFTDYEVRTKKIISSIPLEIDSVKKIYSVQQIVNDSIKAEISKVKESALEISLHEENLRQKLAAGCDSINFMLKLFSPWIISTYSSPIQLLRNEIISKNVSNIEAMNRINQIANDIEHANSTIQVSQESSPIPDIRGEVYRLRIGTFYEAIVDEKGEKGAVWYGYDNNGNTKWNTLQNADECEKLIKAVKIREGKSLPDFAVLPIKHPSSSDSGVVQ